MINKREVFDLKIAVNDIGKEIGDLVELLYALYKSLVDASDLGAPSKREVVSVINRCRDYLDRVEFIVRRIST